MLGARQLGRAGEEVQVDPAALAGRRPARPLLHHGDIAGHRLVRGGDGSTRLIELHIGRVHDDVRIGELAELTQLLGREGRLGGTAAAQDVDVRDLGLGQGVEHVLRHVRVLELGNGLREHPGHIDRDVAHADHDDAGGPRDQVLEQRTVGIRVTAVPGHEVRRRDASRQVLAGDPQPPVSRGAVGQDDRVIVGVQVGHRDVGPDADVAQKPDPVLVEHLVQGVADRSDAEVVRSHAVPHQAEGHRQPIEDIHLHGDVRTG